MPQSEHYPVLKFPPPKQIRSLPLNSTLLRLPEHGQNATTLLDRMFHEWWCLSPPLKPLAEPPLSSKLSTFFSCNNYFFSCNIYYHGPLSTVCCTPGLFIQELPTPSHSSNKAFQRPNYLTDFLQQQSLLSVLSFYITFVVLSKYPTRSNWKKIRVSSLVWCLRRSFYQNKKDKAMGNQSMVEVGNQLVTWLSQSGKHGDECLCSARFLFPTRSEDQAHGIVTPIFRMGLPISIQFPIGMPRD